jgi:hypothetical protein
LLYAKQCQEPHADVRAPTLVVCLVWAAYAAASCSLDVSATAAWRLTSSCIAAAGIVQQQAQTTCRQHNQVLSGRDWHQLLAMTAFMSKHDHVLKLLSHQEQPLAFMNNQCTSL